ncbi:unnamed protein product [Polarella glacialis]|uniref:Uncharacterized protein n=1 Tax=Polarella glacialis TaxID=89957 RepID=A0A813G9S3_POLGL|nr:unnamed protein product [Polarella glacialis]
MVGPSIPFDTRFNVQRRHQITTCGTIVEVMIIKHVDPASNLLLTTEAAAEHSEEAAAEHIEAYASSVVLRAVADDDVEAPLAEEAPASPAAPASVAVEEDAEEAPPAPVVVEEEAEVAGPAPTILEEDAEEAPPAPVAVEEEAEVAAPAPAILEEDAEEEDAEEAPPAPVAVEEEAEVAAPAPAILEEDAEEAPPAPVTVEEEAEVAAPAPAILEEDAEEAPPAPVAVEEEAKVAAPAPAILEEDAEEAPPAPVAVEEEAEVAAPALAILEEDAEEAPPAPVAVEEEAEVAAPAPAILEEDAEEAPPAPVAVEEAAEVAAPAPVEEEAEEANPAPAIEEDAEEAPASPGAASSTKAGGSSMRDRRHLFQLLHLPQRFLIVAVKMACLNRSRQLKLALTRVLRTLRTCLHQILRTGLLHRLDTTCEKMCNALLRPPRHGTFPNIRAQNVRSVNGSGTIFGYLSYLVMHTLAPDSAEADIHTVDRPSYQSTWISRMRVTLRLVRPKRFEDNVMLNGLEGAASPLPGQEHGHPAVAVEAARARVNLGAALSEGFRHQEALVAIKEAQKGLSQVLTWASDCNPDDSGVGAIAHEARALRCAALVAEAIQLELCPAEARSGPSPMVQMAAEAERLGGHPMATLARDLQSQAAGYATRVPQPARSASVGAVTTLPPIGQSSAPQLRQVRVKPSGAAAEEVEKASTSPPANGPSRAASKRSPGGQGQTKALSGRPRPGGKGEDGTDVFTDFLRGVEAERVARLGALNSNWEDQAKRKLGQVHRTTKLALDLMHDDDLKEKRYTHTGHQVFMKAMKQNNRCCSDPALMAEAAQMRTVPEICQVRKLNRQLFVKPQTPPPPPPPSKPKVDIALGGQLGSRLSRT